MRSPPRNVLVEALAAVRQTSASGWIFFRLPGGASAEAWSLRQAADWRAREALALHWRASSCQLELVNAARGDLEPRQSGPGGALDRNYALEVDAPAPVFREAPEGDFWRVAAHLHPDDAPRR